jgi:hypothetical protein
MKCILEVIFCVFSTACNSVSVTPIVSKWQYLQLEKQSIVAKGQMRRVGWAEDDSHAVFWQKIPWQKGKCDMVYCCDGAAQLLAPEFRADSSYILMKQNKTS